MAFDKHILPDDVIVPPVPEELLEDADISNMWRDAWAQGFLAGRDWPKNDRYKRASHELYQIGDDYYSVIDNNFAEANEIIEFFDGEAWPSWFTDQTRPANISEIAEDERILVRKLKDVTIRNITKPEGERAE